MKKVKIAILLFFIAFLSLCNLKTGLIFKTTDTETNTLYASHTTQDLIEPVNIPKLNDLEAIKTQKSEAKTVASSQPNNTVRVNGNTVPFTWINCDNSMPTTGRNDAYLCKFRAKSYKKTGLFLYGHNYDNVFGKLKNLHVGDTFTINDNGKITTYRVSDSFYLSLDNANEVRSDLYYSTYRGYSDLTIQTCEGQNGRRYIKANAI